MDYKLLLTAIGDVTLRVLLIAALLGIPTVMAFYMSTVAFLITFGVVAVLYVIGGLVISRYRDLVNLKNRKY